MAVVVTPTKEQWEMLREIGLFSGGAIVLLSPEAAEATDINPDDMDDLAEEYDFGGESDMSVEIVASKEHYFFKWLEEANCDFDAA